MFSFGWLMNHLGVVLYDAFGILVGFLEKGKKQANLVNFWGPTSRRRDPRQQRRSTPSHGRGEAWTSLEYAEA